LRFNPAAARIPPGCKFPVFVKTALEKNYELPQAANCEVLMKKAKLHYSEFTTCGNYRQFFIDAKA